MLKTAPQATPSVLWYIGCIVNAIHVIITVYPKVKICGKAVPSAREFDTAIGAVFSQRYPDFKLLLVLEPVHINRNARISKRILRRTRRKFADVLYVLQELSTKLCGK